MPLSTKNLREKEMPSCAAIVIFGATGDLTQRKIIPALFNLFKRSHLPSSSSIVCFGRREYTDQSFRELALTSFKKFTKKDPEASKWKAFSNLISYCKGDFDEDDAYARLAGTLESLDKKGKGHLRVMYYFATAPDQFSKIVDGLKRNGLAASTEDAWPRLIFEKPFGHDLASAQELNRHIKTVFHEKQVFRIDHYLGKETVQNILVMRFSNSIYEHLWNNRYIDSIQITAAESIGVEGRAGYFDSSGALRDMVQNHLMQLLTYVAMEPPTSLNADEIRDEKVKVLKSLRPMTPAEIGKYAVRGQYGPTGSEPGYTGLDGVAKGSKTETFVALQCHLHNWRWEGVPFFLRTGKRLKRRTTEIVVTFKQAPGVLFNDPSMGGMEPNRLIIRIQPDEGIGLRFNSKRPVTELAIDPVMMDFCHSCIFSPNTPEAYERLIYDCLLGDSTLFTRWDEVEKAWEFVDPIRRSWDSQKGSLPSYTPGSWGPAAADDLIKKSGREWFDTKHGH